MKFEGIITPAITPLSADGQIDHKAYAEVLESLIDAGVHNILLAGSTGEYYAHTQQERLDLAVQAKKIIGNRVPLIVGTGSIRTEDSIIYAKHAKEIGADAILITTPPYAMPNEDENAEHALAIDRAAGLPIMLYNYKARMGVEMGERYFSRVSESKNFMSIKESSGSTNNIHLLALKFPNIALSCGWDDQALEFFAWGARSWVCAASNFLPKEHIALYEACVLEKDFAKGRAIMGAMMPLMDYLERCGKFVQSIKFACETVGLPAGNARLPLKPLTPELKEELTDIIKTLKTNVAKVVQAGA